MAEPESLCAGGTVDHEADISIFESGAILWYLAEKDPEHRLVPEVRAWKFLVLYCCLQLDIKFDGSLNFLGPFAPLVVVLDYLLFLPGLKV